MNPFSIIPAIIIVLLALVTISVLNRWFNMQPPAGGRYVAIDGLRGYLAFFVFLHHAAVWYSKLYYYRWANPPSALYNHFGPTSVYYFFMITAFLFITKLINAREKGINWQQLYISRIFRIVPLYLFAMLVLFIIVAAVSHFTPRQPWWQVSTQLLGWIGFMQPDINGIRETWIIMAGVTWSLCYEWLFYGTLPFWWAWLLAKPIRWQLLAGAGLAVAACCIIISIYSPYQAWKNSIPFTAGIVTAFLIRKTRLQQIASSVYVSFLIPVLLIIVVLFYKDSLSPVPALCNWVIFMAIAGGNTLFGILSHKASFLLGQISYSLYLLHGMLLYSIFQFAPGITMLASTSALLYWLVIAITGMMLTILCTFTYYYIEQPGIQATYRFSGRNSGYRTAAEPAP